MRVVVVLWVVCGMAVGMSYHGCDTVTAKSLPYCDVRVTYAERTKDLIDRMTLEERIAVISPSTNATLDDCPVLTDPIDRLGVPSYMWLTEANTGAASACYDKDHCATTFVSPAMMASSFNRTSWRGKGRVISTEMRALTNLNWYRPIRGDEYNGVYKIGVTGYGPNMNIVRDPRFGRNEELPSEDPVLTGTYATEYVKGLQEKDSKGRVRMLAYLKHFTDYTVEDDRGHFNANVSKFDFFDSFLPQYEQAFKEGGASGAMCSYNAENNHPSCANGWLLNEVIRKRWNRPDALITTDCGAIENMMEAPLFAPTPEAASAWALMNGTDIEAGSRFWTQGSLRNAVEQGLATQEAVWNAAYRAIYQLMTAGLFDPLEDSEWNRIGVDAIGAPEHRQLNYEAALQGLVLLKNEDKFLPLRSGQKIAVVGPHAISQFGMLEDYAGDQICWVDYSCITTIGDAISKMNNAAGGSTYIEKGVDIDSDDVSGIPAAIEAVKKADVVILAIGIDRTVEYESVDRTKTSLPGMQSRLIEEVYAAGVPVVMLMLNGGALGVEQFVDQPRAIIEAWYPSEEGARAISASMFGYENRWGKLPITIYPSSYVDQVEMNNMEMAKGIGRTYRYYQGEPTFSFGSGLSYTSFVSECVVLLHETAISCKVSNVGDKKGDEVLMVFHRVDDGIRGRVGKRHPIPIQNLVDFERVSLDAGESTMIKFAVQEKWLSLINEDGDRVVYKGKHELFVSRDGRHGDFTYTVDVERQSLIPN